MLSSAELFDPATDTFSSAGVGSLNVGRAFAAAAPLANGDVLIAGGETLTTALSSAELFNPTTGAFSLTGSMTIPRQDAVAAPLPDGKVLIAGGDAVASGTPDIRASAELFDPASSTFSSAGVGSMTTARSGAVAAALPDGTVLIAGGQDADAAFLNGAERFFTPPQAVAFGGDFGAQTVAQPSPAESLTVTNRGAELLSISGATVGGGNPGDFAITADGCAGHAIRFDQTCTITVRFTPSQTGTRSATITLRDNEASPASITVSGTGVAPNGGPPGPQGPARPARPTGPQGPGSPGPAGLRGPQGRRVPPALPAR